MHARLVIPSPMFMSSMRAFLKSAAEHGEALPFDPAWDASDADFIRYINNLARGFWTPDHVTESESISSHYWYLVDNQVLGQCTLRMKLVGEFGESHGHIGYGIHPEFRNLGHATKLLDLLLDVAAQRGLTSVMITCNPANLASKRVIEKNGGVLRDLFQGSYERFDIDLKGRSRQKAKIRDF